MKKIYAIFVCSLIIFSACKKEETKDLPVTDSAWELVKAESFEEVEVGPEHTVFSNYMSNYKYFLLKSDDNGKSWHEATNIGAEPFKARKLTSHKDRIYATTNGGGLYFTDYKNISWTQSTTLAVKKVEAITSFKNQLLVSADSALYLSEDDGASWQKIFNEPVRTIYANDTVLMFSTESRHLYSTKDKGNTLVKDSVVYSGEDGNFNVTARQIVIAGNDLFVSTARGIYKKDKNTGSWNIISNSFSHQNFTAFSTFDNYLIATSLGRNLFISDDFGNTWKNYDQGIKYELNGDNFFLGFMIKKAGDYIFMAGGTGLYKRKVK